MIWPSTPTLPVPVARCSTGTSRRWARAWLRALTAMSGYRFIWVAASCTTFSTLGSGGYGFSLLLILYAVAPSRGVAGLPGL